MGRADQRQERHENLDRRKSDVDVFDHVIGGVRASAAQTFSTGERDSNENRADSYDAGFHGEP
jgi:hypothetical protein